jgi:hypothetical protein
MSTLCELALTSRFAAFKAGKFQPQLARGDDTKPLGLLQIEQFPIAGYKNFCLSGDRASKD